jgi:hypothetical protein
MAEETRLLVEVEFGDLFESEKKESSVKAGGKNFGHQDFGVKEDMEDSGDEDEEPLLAH